MQPNPNQANLDKPGQHQKPLKNKANITNHGLHPQKEHDSLGLPKKHKIKQSDACMGGMGSMSQSMPQQQAMAAPAMTSCPQQCPQQTVACQAVAAPPCPQQQGQVRPVFMHRMPSKNKQRNRL